MRSGTSEGAQCSIPRGRRGSSNGKGKPCASSYRSSTARPCSTSFVTVGPSASGSFERRISPTRTDTPSTPIATSYGSATSLIPGSSRSRPTSAVLVLNDYDTGYPFALLESSIISAARTAASAALAADWLSRRARRAHSLGIVGTGFIARYVYDFLVDTGWEIDEVRLYDASPVESEKFRNTACRPEHHHTVAVVPDVAQLVRACDLILFTTVAS